MIFASMCWSSSPKPQLFSLKRHPRAVQWWEATKYFVTALQSVLHWSISFSSHFLLLLPTLLSQISVQSTCWSLRTYVGVVLTFKWKKEQSEVKVTHFDSSSFKVLSSSSDGTSSHSKRLQLKCYYMIKNTNEWNKNRSSMCLPGGRDSRSTVYHHSIKLSVSCDQEESWLSMIL